LIFEDEDEHEDDSSNSEFRLKGPLPPRAGQNLLE